MKYEIEYYMHNEIKGYSDPKKQPFSLQFHFAVVSLKFFLTEITDSDPQSALDLLAPDHLSCFNGFRVRHHVHFCLSTARINASMRMLMLL